MKKTFREWRKEAGLTSSYVAKNIGLSTYTLNAKERGDKPFTCFQTKLLCDLYKVEIDDVQPVFLGRSAPKMGQEVNNEKH